jgi:hypothetical protein
MKDFGWLSGLLGKHREGVSPAQNGEHGWFRQRLLVLSYSPHLLSEVRKRPRLYFKDGELLETDHIIPHRLGGTIG